MESYLKWPDYLILVAFLAISLAIGVYHALTGGRQKTTAEFIMANRQLKIIPTAISLLVSFQSAIMVLGSTAEMYGYGIQYMIFSAIGGCLALVLVERIIVPWIYPMKLVSMFAYLEMRFMSRSIRIFGASMGIVAAILYMGVAMYAPSAALESATGLPLTVSIPIMAIVSVTYTALGGMRAVIWTDVFQFLIMIGGMIAILIKGLLTIGGISNVFRFAGEEGRLVWANVSFDPRERNTVWSIIAGMGIFWFQSFGLSQAAVQRYSATETLSKARATILLNIPPLILTQTAACTVGLIVLAFYSTMKCDPLASKAIANPNELLPHFVVTIFADSPGFAGLFLSTLYGGALSSVSSSLSGSAANCWEDILKFKLDHLPETTKAIINRLLVVLFGTLSIAVAFLSASLPGPITQVAIGLFSSVYGPLLAFYLLGGLSRHANWKGTILGGVVGLLATLWLCMGSMTVLNKHPPLPPVSVEQCSVGNSSSAFLLPSMLNYTNYTSFDILHGIDSKDDWNETTEVQSTSPQSQVTQLRGLDNLYAISYLWLTPLGTIITGVVGIVASLILRDRELESRVDERLLLRFRWCRSFDKNENHEHLSHKKNWSMQEVRGLRGSEDINDAEMKTLTKTENGNSNGDHRKDTENGLFIKPIQ